MLTIQVSVMIISTQMITFPGYIEGKSKILISNASSSYRNSWPMSMV